jgi:hypothetical protein
MWTPTHTIQAKREESVKHRVPNGIISNVTTTLTTTTIIITRTVLLMMIDDSRNSKNVGIHRE